MINLKNNKIPKHLKDISEIDKKVSMAGGKEEALDIIEDFYHLQGNKTVAEEIYNSVISKGTTKDFKTWHEDAKWAEDELKKIAAQEKIIDRQGNEIYPADKLKAVVEMRNALLGKARVNVDVTSGGDKIKIAMVSADLVNALSDDDEDKVEDFYDVQEV